MDKTAENDRDNTLLNLGKQILDLTEDQRVLLGKLERQSNKRYHQSRLSELKERVGRLQDQGDKYAPDYYTAISDVLSLIEKQ